MAERSQKTTPFKEGQNTNDHKGNAPAVNVHFNMAFEKRNGQPDMLAQSLTTPPREFMDTQHFSKRGVEPNGHAYSPKWAPMNVDSRNKSKATSMKSKTSKPGEGALGKALNKVGEKSGYKKFTPKGGGKKP